MQTRFTVMYNLHLYFYIYVFSFWIKERVMRNSTQICYQSNLDAWMKLFNMYLCCL